MKIPGLSKAAFRKALVAASSGCRIQHTGWPCGTDFPFEDLDWKAVLAYRGDYDKDYRTKKADGTVVYRFATDIVFKDGVFSHHVFEDFSEKELKKRILKLAKHLKVEVKK